MKDFCQIEANKDTSYYSMRSIFSYAPMSFQRIEKKTSHCSMGTRSHLASSAGKFETLGSNFSNETRICEAACVLILQSKKSFTSFAINRENRSKLIRFFWFTFLRLRL